jgi:hypothetical protein
MEIHAIYAVFKGGSVKIGNMEYSGNRMILGITEEFSYSISRESEVRLPVVIVDTKGFNARYMDDRLLKSVSVPGADIWYFTCIKDIEDLFDAFMGEITKVLMPYNKVRNRLVLEEIFEVSDDCIPVIFSGKDMIRQIDDVKRIGFSEAIVMDPEGSISENDWAELKEMSINVIPFVRSRSSADILHSIGFEKIILDFQN